MQRHVQTFSHKSIRLEGAPNFRDLGGYTARSGQKVRNQLIFRSDHLGKLTPEDLLKLTSLNNKPWLVLDFRGSEERKTHACTLPGATVQSLAIEPTVVQALTHLLSQGTEVSSHTTIELMQDTYRNFILHHSDKFKAFFEALVAHPDFNIVFHCTAGKDRTGIAAVLLLHALDIPMETIWHDYLLTNERLKHISFFESSPEIAKVLQTVQPAFLDAALDTINTHYSGLDHFLTHSLGLSKTMRLQLSHMFLA